MSAVAEDRHPLALPDCVECRRNGIPTGYVLEWLDFDDLEPRLLVCNCVLRQQGDDE